MVFPNNKKTKLTASIAIIMLFALSTGVSAVLADLPTNYAFPPRPTGTVVGVSPTLVGLGQSVLINIFTYPAPTGPTYYAQSLVPGLTGGFSDISCTITDPDGVEDTFMPVDETLLSCGINIPGQAQIVGSLQFRYKPTKVGEYSVTASFPGKTYTTAEQYPNMNDTVYYEPSSTPEATTFTVQQDIVLSGQLNGYPWSPLPNDYWTNPVSTNNREWAAISGDWTQAPGELAYITTPYNQYSTSPNSSHIVWANQVAISGLVGGAYGSLAYNSVGGLFGTFGNIVLNGRIYQNGGTGYFDCIDERTGEKLFSAPGSVTIGWHYSQTGTAFQGLSNMLNEGGIQALLWGGWSVFGSSDTWTAYNPFDGTVVRTLVNAPTNLDEVQWTDGDNVVWCTQSPGFNMGGMNPGFNNTRPLQNDYENLIKWDYSKVIGNDWSTGIVWNVSVTEDNEVGPGDNGFFGFRAFPFPAANVVIVRSHNANQYMAGYDYTTGAKLWKNNATILDIGVTDPTGGPDGPIIMIDGATHSYVAYDVNTGNEIWRASGGEYPWGVIPAYEYVTNVTGRAFYYGSYDGHVYAVNVDTGKPIWTSDYVGALDESIYGNQAFGYGLAAGADNRLYFSTATVYNLEPRTRFHLLVCIDETTGHFIWKLPIGVSPTAIANGYLVGLDFDNGIQYCIGKGKTETTVIAPLNTVAAGTAVLIQGTINDMSPGKPSTPAVADSDMAEWMDYLYGQNATLLNNPPKPDGVPIRLSAIAPNGDVIELGTVTSDSGGMFKKMWTPETEGAYTIYATFDGSDSYWGSYAETALGVVEAPSQGQPETEEPSAEAPAFPTTEVAIVAAVAVVAVVAIAAYWALRRRR
jgi:outer membrane protein assembly factor BamB